MEVEKLMVVVSSGWEFSPETFGPEALEAQLQGELPGPVRLLVHDGVHRLRVLHDDGHLAVPLPQHAAVVDVGGTCRQTGSG